MRHKLIITLSVALVAASLQAVGGAVAAEGRYVRPATGQWAGFAQSSIGNPNDRPVPFSLEIASQSGPFVRGELVGLGGPDTKSALTGVVSPSGRAALLGVGGGGASVLNWSPAALPQVPGWPYCAAGSDAEQARCIFEGDYLRFGPGVTDRGRLVVVHQIPDPMAPSIAGAWRGTAQAIGNPDIRPVEAQFTQSDGILAGRLTLGSGERSATFELAGHTAALEGGGVGVEMVGGGDGMILINGFGDGSVRDGLTLSYRWIGGPAGAEEGAIIIIGD